MLPQQPADAAETDLVSFGKLPPWRAGLERFGHLAHLVGRQPVGHVSGAEAAGFGAHAEGGPVVGGCVGQLTHSFTEVVREVVAVQVGVEQVDGQRKVL